MNVARLPPIINYGHVGSTEFIKHSFMVFVVPREYMSRLQPGFMAITKDLID